MRAFLLAAGLGTRLRPLTDDRPKALVEVAGKPMIHYPLTYLEKMGINEVTVNVHYHSEKLIPYLNEYNQNSKIAIRIQDETDRNAQPSEVRELVAYASK